MTRVKGQYRGLMASGCAAARRERMAIWIVPISKNAGCNRSSIEMT
jgi:hypothetical protein